LIFFFSGIEKVDVDLATKRVVVTGSATAEEILAAIKKTGKACELVQGA
jgi:copper chaperone CopZ